MSRVIIRGLLIFTLFSVGGVAIAADEISQINFVTPPQTIVPGGTSETITVQTQNDVGVRVSLSETADLILQSSSPTGEFSSSAASWQPVTQMTMARGSANRNFYYRDAVAGAYTLTASVVGRETGRRWTVSQEMAVGEAASGQSGDSAPAISSVPTAVSPALIQSRAAPARQPFSVSAGVRISAAAGAPVSFRAQVSGINKEVGGYKLVWSFGDGVQELGKEVLHTYYFPGVYMVVLRGYQGDEQAAARTTVEVFSPEIEIAGIGLTPVPHLLLANRSDREVDLGGFGLQIGGRLFVFPSDTILAAKAQLHLPVGVVGVPLTGGETVKLVSPNGGLIAFYQPSSSRNEVLNQVNQRLQAINRRVDELRRDNVEGTKPLSEKPLPGNPDENTSEGTPAVLELPKPNNAFQGYWQRFKNLFVKEK